VSATTSTSPRRSHCGGKDVRPMRPSAYPRILSTCSAKLCLRLWKIGEPVAVERDGWKSVSLRAQQCVVLGGPGMHGSQKVVVCQFGEGSAPVAPNRGGFGIVWPCQCKQMRTQIVAAPMFELRQQSRRPVRCVVLKAVAEYGVRRFAPKAERRRSPTVRRCSRMAAAS